MPPRKSNAKFWCEYCRVYVFDNKICRTKHDNSPEHKAALARYVERVQKDEREHSRMMKDFEQRTGVRLEKDKSKESSSSFYQSSKRPQPVTLLGMKGPIAVSKRKNVVGTAPIQIAHVGSWSFVPRPMDNKEPSEPIPSFESSENATQPCDCSTGSESDADCVLSEPHSSSIIPEPCDSDQPANLIEEIEPLQIELRKFKKPTNLRK